MIGCSRSSSSGVSRESDWARDRRDRRRTPRCAQSTARAGRAPGARYRQELAEHVGRPSGIVARPRPGPRDNAGGEPQRSTSGRHRVPRRRPGRLREPHADEQSGRRDPVRCLRLTTTGGAIPSASIRSPDSPSPSAEGPAKPTPVPVPADALPERMLAAVRAAAGDVKLDLVPDVVAGAAQLDGTADDGAGPGRLLVVVSPAASTIQTNLCLDRDFVQGGRCKREPLPNGDILYRRGLVEAGDAQTFVVAIQRGDGGGPARVRRLPRRGPARAGRRRSAPDSGDHPQRPDLHARRAGDPRPCGVGRDQALPPRPVP